MKWSLLSSLVVSVLLVGAYAGGKDKKRGSETAPLPSKVLEAKTLFLRSNSGASEDLDTLYTELRKWGKYRVVQDKSQADIVLSLEESDWSEPPAGPLGPELYMSRKTCILRFTDPGTGDVLWTESGTAFHSAARGTGYTIRSLVESIKRRSAVSQPQ